MARRRVSDGKKISGAGRLTESAINKLQNYFGIAIRQNTDSAHSMKKCALASLFHNTAFDDNKRHRLCPIGENSWCKWQKEVAVSGKSGFKPKLSLPTVIFDLVFPIYQDLSKDELLEKCLHGKTQNANEALHGLIWQRCSKVTFSGRKVLEIAVASAVCMLNDGA